MEFKKIELSDKASVKKLSQTASEIVKEYYDPIIGARQNDYMIEKFQSVSAITHQLETGYQYYLVLEKGEILGFLAFYPRGNALYLSKFYLYQEKRGKGYARKMLAFLTEAAKKEHCQAIELNVNKNNNTTVIYEKLGFQKIRSEKNDIGNGFYMDDYVYQLVLPPEP